MIILASLIIGVVLVVVFNEIFNSTSSDAVEGISMVLVVLGWSCLVAAFIMGVIAIIESVTGPSTLVAYQVARDSLVHQAEDVRYDNDNQLGKKELADQIEEYNKKVAIGKLRQHDFWVGWFYADIYDQLELIPVSVLE